MERRIKENIKLFQPITVALEGQPTEVFNITIKGPSASVRKPASALKAMFEKPWRESLEKMVDDPDVKEARKEKADTSTDDGKKEKTDFHPRDLFTPGNVVGTLSSYRDDKVGARDALDTALDYLKEILCNGGADFEGVDMKLSHFNKLYFADAENILGEYVANFLLDSLFS